MTYGNGSVQGFGYDAASRLSTLTNNLNGSGTAHDLTQTFNYNPAGQISSVTRSNDAYAWQAHYNVDRSYVMDGLNRIMNVGSTAFAYDGRGNGLDPACGLEGLDRDLQRVITTVFPRRPG